MIVPNQLKIVTPSNVGKTGSELLVFRRSILWKGKRFVYWKISTSSGSIYAPYIPLFKVTLYDQ
jgi:hypothetical protein